jgi:hypothetical protein
VPEPNNRSHWPPLAVVAHIAKHRLGHDEEPSMPWFVAFVRCNPGLITLPIIAGVLIYFMLKMKARYLSDGTFFKRKGLTKKKHE